MKTKSLILFLVCFLPLVAQAQDEVRFAWQVANYELTANIQPDRTLNTVAVVNVKNIGRSAGNTFTFRVNAKAAVKSVTVGGATATFRATPEAQGGIQRVTTTLPAPVGPNGTLSVTINYSLPVESNSGFSAVSPIGSQFLPLSFWYPTPNAPFNLRGPDTAPFKLTVNGPGVVSSGVDKSSGSSSVFEQALSATPFFVQGDWDRVEGAGEAKGVTAFVPKGLSADERKQAEILAGVVGSARTYLTSLLGPGPDVPLRLIIVRRGAGIYNGGALLLDRSVLRRIKVDSATALLIGEAVAQTWIGGQAAIRGEGGGAIREGLNRFLATQFIEKQFGREAAQGELFRQRLSYIGVAKRDGPIARSTALDESYFSSVPNKGAMVWRLIDQRMGREAFLRALKTWLQAGRDSGNGVSLASLRAELAQQGGEQIKNTLDPLLDQVTDMDLMIGLPQQRGAEWVAALRNLGSTEANVRVIGITDRGEQLVAQSTIPSRGFAEAVFRTPAKLVRAEVDPDKVYPQVDFSNDTAPRSRGINESISDALRALAAQDFVKAESFARELFNGAPLMQEARITLARALLAQGKLDEAERLFRQALDDPLPTPLSLAWGSMGLGQINLRRNQNAEAVRRFNEAVRTEADYPTSVAARAERIKAEQAAGVTVPVDEAARAFVTQLDAAVSAAKRPELEAMVVPGELVRFVGSMVGTITWQTRALRTEQMDANTMLVDVAIQAKDLGQERSGTALFVLSRVGGAWKLAAIDLFEVR